MQTPTRLTREGEAPAEPKCPRPRNVPGSAGASPSLQSRDSCVIGGMPDDFKTLIEDGIARYGAIIKAAGIEAE